MGTAFLAGGTTAWVGTGLGVGRGLGVAVGFFIYRGLHRLQLPESKYFYWLVLAVLTLLPRIVWVLTIDTTPVSDFQLYNDYAINVSHGDFKSYPESYPLFPFKFGYPLILGAIYRFSGQSLMAAKLFNILISLLVAFIIYRASAKLFNEKAGRAAGIIFGLWPAQIMYTSVLASEHVFILFFSMSITLFIQMQFFNKGARRYVLPVLMGIFLAFAHFIRPVSVILFPVLFVYLFVVAKNTPLKRAIVSKVFILLLVGVGFLTTIGVLNATVRNLTGVSILKSSSGFSLLVGTNFNSSGMYNADDEKIIYENNFDYEKIHGEGTRIAIERILSNPKQFALLAEKKFIIQWASEDFAMLWSINNLNRETGVSSFILARAADAGLVLQLGYAILLLLAGAGFFLSYRNGMTIQFIILLLLGVFVAAHTLLEVQSRYHYSVIPLMVIAAGYGLSEGFDRVKGGVGWARKL